MTDYKLTVNGETLNIAKDEAEKLDVLSLDNSHFHLLQNGKAFRLKVLETDFGKKTMQISVNGNAYNVSIADGYDQIVKEMGLLSNAFNKINEIKAPMPGLILDVMVEVGQEIVEGTPLLVLSAMKMENIILSQGEGTVKAISVKKDDAVDKGQVIIEME